MQQHTHACTICFLWQAFGAVNVTKLPSLVEKTRKELERRNLERYMLVRGERLEGELKGTEV